MKKQKMSLLQKAKYQLEKRKVLQIFKQAKKTVRSNVDDPQERIKVEKAIVDSLPFLTIRDPDTDEIVTEDNLKQYSMNDLIDILEVIMEKIELEL